MKFPIRSSHLVGHLNTLVSYERGLFTRMFIAYIGEERILSSHVL